MPTISDVTARSFQLSPLAIAVTGDVAPSKLVIGACLLSGVLLSGAMCGTALAAPATVLLSQAVASVIPGAAASTTVDVPLVAKVSPPRSEPEYAEFNSSFFDRGGESPAIDLRRFEKGTPLEPGTYRLDIYVNDVWVGRQPLRAVSASPLKDGPVHWCLTPSQFGTLGIDTSKLPPDDQKKITGDCVDFLTTVPDGTLSVDQSDLSARFTVPQLYVGRRVSGYVDPSEWDRGVTAGFLMYNTNLYKTDTQGSSSSTQSYAGINAGINLADWRLRYNGSYNRSEGNGSSTQSHYDSISTYAQRDVTSLKSQLTAGQYYTPSDVFDSVPFTGVQLASDDRMLPDSQRGFAPDIRGVAETNARVQVKQGDNVIYETTVAPGPFEINDLYNTGYAGDLTVQVTEADGRVKSFLVPYASVSQLVRPGVSRFSVTGGKYRDDSLEREPNFVQGTYQYGVSNLMTAYTGGIGAENYLAGLGGLAFSTSFGALAADVTYSSAHQVPEIYGAKNKMQGQSYRLTYSKLLEATSTNMTIAAYRFNSENYLSLQDFAQLWGRDDNDWNQYRQRNRYQLNVNQPVGNNSTVFFYGSQQDYWNHNGTDTSYQAGYNTGFSWGSVGVAASRTRSDEGNFDTTYTLNVTVPIELGNGRAVSLSTNVNYDDSKNNSVQTTLAGTAGDQRQVSYSVYGSDSRNQGDRSDNGGGSVTYNAPQAIYNANFSTGDGYKQAGVGARGSIVVHPGGINFSQDQGETLAVVEAKGAEGASVSTNIGAKVASNGYAVVGGLTPYRQNDIELDPKGTSKDVELQVTSQTVAPRYGSIVMLKYPTVTGAPVLLTVKRDDGETIPMGAEVLDAKGNSLSMVGQGGRIFLRGLESKGELMVKWGEGSGQRCQINYQLPAGENKTSSFLKTDANCRAVLDKPALAQN